MENKNMNASQTPATESETVNRFRKLIADYETAYTSGNDFTNELYALAQAAAMSVIKKCIDPQRKTAGNMETVSNSGHNPALAAVKRGIMSDLALLENTAAAHNAAVEWKFNKDGYVVSEIVDKAAAESADKLSVECLTDGIDLVQTAAVAILETSAEHATPASGWMEAPYTVNRISRKVYIRLEDTAEWVDEETSPIREVYRTIRREVQNSRAIQADPRNGYLYIEDTATDPDSTAVETIYRRLGKYADLGGYTCDMNGRPKYDGVYTADMQSVIDYNDIVERLNLTTRQAEIVRLRMRGYGYKAIATYIGVSFQAVQNAIYKVQAKCEKIGFTPDMWTEMNR